MNPIRLTRPDQGEHFRTGTDVVTIKATGQDTSGTLLVVEVRVPPGGGPPVLHRPDSAKVFYFLEGEFVNPLVEQNSIYRPPLTAHFEAG